MKKNIDADPQSIRLSLCTQTRRVAVQSGTLFKGVQRETEQSPRSASDSRKLHFFPTHFSTRLVLLGIDMRDRSEARAIERTAHTNLLTKAKPHQSAHATPDIPHPFPEQHRHGRTLSLPVHFQPSGSGVFRARSQT